MLRFSPVVTFSAVVMFNAFVIMTHSFFSPFEKGGLRGIFAFPLWKRGIEGDFLLNYSKNLKEKARQLRKNPTDSERRLWSRVRNKQIMGVQFYRQKPIRNYIVDFYAPAANLVIEVDGSQHHENAHFKKDIARDKVLCELGLVVLRFNSREVLLQTDVVVLRIYEAVAEQLKSIIGEKGNPP